MILIYLIILWIPMLCIIGLFSVLNMIQPTLFGFSILDLMKFSFYIILPIIYIATILLSIFKFKVKFDTATALIALIVGYILILGTLIPLKNFLVPSLSEVSAPGLTPVGQGTSVALEYSAIFRNIIFIQSFYLAYIFSIFLSQLMNRKLVKILIFVFGGLLVFFVLGFVGNSIFLWLG